MDREREWRPRAERDDGGPEDDLGSSEGSGRPRDRAQGSRRRRRLGPVSSAVGLARIGAAAWWRTAIWSAAASVRVSSRVIRAASTGQAPVEVFRGAQSEMRSYARRVLGIIDPDELIRQAASEITGPKRSGSGNGAPPRSLREIGAELLRRSADVDFDEGTHPAYARILEDLAPDEARILRLLVTSGPQPSVDVRSGLLPLNSTSELVAPGLNMIGAEAGCRHQEDTPAYLNNLFRLGLIWFSREPLSDPLSYQVLESQPEVIDALGRAGRARTVRRSVELTPFGKQFCELCLPLGGAGERAGRSVGDRGEPDAGEDGDG
ncbi:MAG: Abi-alpha family protein [Solirubrobacterales bacterium]